MFFVEHKITAVKRSRRHTKYGHWCPHLPPLRGAGGGPGSDAALRDWSVQVFWFLNTVVSGEQEKWKDPKGDIHWGCWVGVVRVIAIFLLIWGMGGGACRKEIVGGGRGRDRESLMVGVVRREW